MYRCKFADIKKTINNGKRFRKTISGFTEKSK